MASSEKKSVLFVCLGNICRSPIAEAVFAHLVKERGLTEKWRIDSAGTIDMHTGSGPDGRAKSILSANGVTTKHKARQITKNDYREFDFIFGMDHDNMDDLKEREPADSKAKLLMLGSYDPKKQLIIVDPYYGGEEGFKTVFEQCKRCCAAFLDEQSK